MSTILVVEDNQINAELMEDILQLAGHNAMIARDGSEAVRIYCDYSPDLIFMDCNMPIMDGYEASIRIRQFEEDHHLEKVPIVALTGNSLTTQKSRGLRCGMNEIIEKPIDFDQIMKVVDRYTKNP